ncbi:MAG TPA: PEP-CTERM sorting domain-containing protein, partial [Massilia timonae]|nr:PEP-CTERM sorting domain-containing protein [Massilia timonae]
MLRITPLLFAAALLAQPAQAAVTYSWQQVEASESMPPGLNFEL